MYSSLLFAHKSSDNSLHFCIYYADIKEKTQLPRAINGGDKGQALTTKQRLLTYFVETITIKKKFFLWLPLTTMFLDIFRLLRRIMIENFPK